MCVEYLFLQVIRRVVRRIIWRSRALRTVVLVCVLTNTALFAGAVIAVVRHVVKDCLIILFLNYSIELLHALSERSHRVLYLYL